MHFSPTTCDLSDECDCVFVSSSGIVGKRFEMHEILQREFFPREPTQRELDNVQDTLKTSFRRYKTLRVEGDIGSIGAAIKSQVALS